MSRGIAFRVVALVLGCLAGAFIAEIGLRALGVETRPQLTKRLLTPAAHNATSPTVTHYHCFATNPNGEFVAAPEVRAADWRLLTNMMPPRELPLSRLGETPWCVQYVLSNGRMALRDWDPRMPGTTNGSRIAVLGDSFVRGVGVPSHRTLPAQLQPLLGGKSTAINAGFPGVGLRQEVRILRALSEKLRPDAALVVFIPNDIELSAALSQRQDYINDLIIVRDEYLADHEARAWYGGGSRLLHLVGSFFDRRRISRETIDWYLDSYDPEQNREGLAVLAADLGALADVRDCPVALVLYPLLVGLEGDYPLAPIHAQVASMATEAGIPVLDLAPAFAGQRTESLYAHPTDHHPNGRAHGIAARAIADWIASTGWVDGIE